MARQTTDVLVVGAGLMGASAAWHLAGRGHRVALIEQFELDHVRGSSHGASRIFRFAYDDTLYIRLAQLALPLWRRAEADLGRPLLWMTGGIDLGPPYLLDPIAGALAAAGCSFDRLTAADAAQRFPAMVIPADWEVMYQPDYGVSYADRCRLGLVELAQRAGAELRTNTRVTRLAPAGASVGVETTGGSWDAGQVVVAAAGWSNRLLEPLDLEVPLTVTRENVAYYGYRDGRQILPFIWHRGDGTHFYGLPNGGPAEVKVGHHNAGLPADPDSGGEVDMARLESVRRFVRGHLPSLEDKPRSAETCLYASTPDDDFIVDRAGPLVLGIGFGGHGFKFGAVIGSLLADRVEGKSTPFDERFARARFQAAAGR